MRGARRVTAGLADQFVMACANAGNTVVALALLPLDRAGVMLLALGLAYLVQYLNRAFAATVEEHGAGWVDYMWPRPGTDISVKKWSYIKRVAIDNTPAFLGIGVYLQ